MVSQHTTSKRSHALAVHGTQIAIVVAILLVWQFTPSSLLDHFLWSTPAAIFVQSEKWLSNGTLVNNAMYTMQSVIEGLVFGSVAGIALGLFTGLRPRIAHIINRPVEVLFAIPKITLVPLFILWFGIGTRQHVIFTALVVFFFFFFSMYSGVRSVPPALRNTLDLLGASPAQIIRLLYLPASLGWMIIALRLAMPYAFVAAISTEVIASTAGLGNLVKNSASVMNSAGMFSAMLVLLFISMVASGIVNLLARRNPWNLNQREN